MHNESSPTRPRSLAIQTPDEATLAEQRKRLNYCKSKRDNAQKQLRQLDREILELQDRIGESKHKLVSQQKISDDLSQQIERQMTEKDNKVNMIAEIKREKDRSGGSQSSHFSSFDYVYTGEYEADQHWACPFCTTPNSMDVETCTNCGLRAPDLSRCVIMQD